MSVPKSVVKIKKNGVQYTSSVDRANYFLFELSRAAMRDVGKYVRKKFRQAYYQTFRKHTGEGPKAISYTVISGRNTKYPRVEIGIRHSAPGKPVPGFYTYFHEVGTSRHKKYGLLSKTVYENIPEIIEIESQYLSGLEDEARALSLIDEEEYSGGGDA